MVFVEDDAGWLPQIHSLFPLSIGIPILVRVAASFSRNASPGSLALKGTLWHSSGQWDRSQGFLFLCCCFCCCCCFSKELLPAFSFLLFPTRKVDTIDRVASCHFDRKTLRTKTYVLRMVEWDNESAWAMNEWPRMALFCLPPPPQASVWIRSTLHHLWGSSAIVDKHILKIHTHS